MRAGIVPVRGLRTLRGPDTRPHKQPGTHALLSRPRLPRGMVKVVSPVSQREVEGTQVDFESVAEPWASYKLSDGSTLKVRTILTAVLRLEGEFDAAGNPIYTVSSQTIVQ